MPLSVRSLAAPQRLPETEPFPAHAAGWRPPVGTLTVAGASRLRANRCTNARLRSGDDLEGLWRGVLGADLHVRDHR